MVNFSEILKGWYPVHLLEEDGQWLIHWMRFDTDVFHEPFFDESIRTARITYPENRRRINCVTSVEAFLAMSPECSTDPDLLIFHSSRCGSTLLAQLFNEMNSTVVLSEMPLLDEIVSGAASGNSICTVELFIAAVNFFRNEKQRLIIKTDSWHIFHFNFFRRCYPDTPALLLYRDPSAIIKSQRRKPGMQSVPGLLSAAQLNHKLQGEYDHRIYFETFLTEWFREALQVSIDGVNVVLANYGDGSQTIFGTALETAEFRITEEERLRTNQRSTFDSKEPGQKFNQTQENLPEVTQMLSVAFRELNAKNSSKGARRTS